MSLRDLNRRHLGLLGLYSTRYAVRGGAGLVFVLLVLTFGLISAHAIVSPVEEAIRKEEKERGRKVNREKYVTGLVEFARPAVEWAIGSGKDPEHQNADVRKWASFLMDDQPALLSAVLLILLFGHPFLISAGAFNQYSGDVSTRGIRYLLLRTERANIYFGRFFGTVCYTALTMALLVFTIILYLGFKLQIYAWGDLLGWGLRGFLALVVLTLPYVAVCGWISAMIDSPFGSLTLGALVVGGVPLFALIGRATWEPAGNIRYVLPWGIQNFLLHHSFGTVLLASLGCLGYTVVFLALGYRHFAKRDL